MSAVTTRVLDLLPEARLQEEASSDKAVTVLGPPGCGKTTSMLRLVDAHLEAGSVSPDRLMVATFTRNAKAEALARLKLTTGLGEERDWPWVKTIHAVCFRLLGLNREQVMAAGNYSEFGAANGYRFSQAERQEDDPFGTNSVQTLGDWCLAAEELRRARLLTPDQAYQQFRAFAPIPAGEGWSMELAHLFAEELQDWKRQQGLFDYTDMLELVLAQGLTPGCSHYFIDEAQDLSTLQWAVVEFWTQSARRVFTFGDDDQAVYAFAGADPHTYITRAAHQVVLSRSWRLPAAVHAEAIRLSARIEERIPKAFEPLGPGGDVSKLWGWYEARIPSAGRVFILARNRAHLGDVRDLLRMRGEPFTDRTSRAGIPEPNSYLGRALRTSFELWRGRLVMSRADLRNLRRQVWKELWPEDEIPRSPTTDAMGLVEMGASGELIRRLTQQPLLALRLNRGDRDYLERLVAEYGPGALSDKPRIELSTIHGVKGEEAEHVFVDTAMTKQTMQTYLREPDSEHRVAYVGATRAKQTLTWVMSGPGYEP